MVGIQEPPNTTLLDHCTPWHFKTPFKSFPHQDITRQSYVAHCRGCLALFNSHTFEPDLEVKSINVPADKAHCGGWASEAVVTKARFRGISRNGKSNCAMMSLLCRNAAAKNAVVL